MYSSCIILSEVVASSFPNFIVLSIIITIPYNVSMTSETTNCDAVLNWERLFTFNFIVKCANFELVHLVLSVDCQQNSFSHYKYI